ncbi:hypothetical protein FB565_004139 [Actinoplanes lutulentus]|uniref:Uncharacterized protein n=1 Tax=Actinoplanes lutulentus TaxID=1287878 RepID=A0A327ZP79_9ACTN|nr:hypothetical protein [Actinoplanes lutulentus]MBB2944410.1 hypothetical protein [Actinoplanes lutulentus]RAK42358.1 hypothetical protein B0I29_102183 [Actinoplanes lutulentus]
MSEPSVWQKRIAGEWHGRPSLFDATGTWCGFEEIRRSSDFVDGVTTYKMDGGLIGGGPLAGQFRLGAPFSFGVVDSDQNRVYTGPDFFGTGQPYGSFVDSHYYGPGWQVDLNTWNQVLPDGETQVYSSVLYQGWSVVGCFNGLYTRVPSRVDSLIEAETRNGSVPYILPTKEAGAYVGELELWGSNQKLRGTVSVAIELEPINLLRTRRTTTLKGAGLDREFTTETRRDGNRLFFEGPEAWGNAIGFGRASFQSVHLTDVWKIKGREFSIDAAPGMSAGKQLAVVYELSDGGSLDSVLHGLLEWQS